MTFLFLTWPQPGNSLISPLHAALSARSICLPPQLVLEMMRLPCWHESILAQISFLPYQFTLAGVSPCGSPLLPEDLYSASLKTFFQPQYHSCLLKMFTFIKIYRDNISPILASHFFDLYLQSCFFLLHPIHVHLQSTFDQSWNLPRALINTSILLAHSQ